MSTWWYKITKAANINLKQSGNGLQYKLFAWNHLDFLIQINNIFATV